MVKISKILAMALLCACNNDVKNAHVFGRLVERTTQKPLKGQKLLVRADYYQGGDYDSYSGYTNKVLVTDVNGRFEAFFDKIACLEIRTKTAQGDTLLYFYEVFGRENRVNLTMRRHQLR